MLMSKRNSENLAATLLHHIVWKHQMKNQFK